MTMKAERQQKERTSRVIQPSKGSGRRHIVDNRKFFSSQKQLLEVIQRDEDSMLPKDTHVYMFTDLFNLVWFRNDSNLWYRPEPAINTRERKYWTDHGDKKVHWSETDEAEKAEGVACYKYFLDPKQIWGKSHEDLKSELIPSNFQETKYRGTSNAHEYAKSLPSSKISIVINYGGGRHDEQKKTYNPAYYYKLEWNKFFTNKCKVINDAYIHDDDEGYEFVKV